MVADGIIYGIHDTDSDLVIPIDETEEDRGGVTDLAAGDERPQESPKRLKDTRFRAELVGAVFRAFDTDADGRLKFQELRIFARRLGLQNGRAFVAERL